MNKISLMKANLFGSTFYHERIVEDDDCTMCLLCPILPVSTLFVITFAVLRIWSLYIFAVEVDDSDDIWEITFQNNLKCQYIPSGTIAIMYVRTLFYRIQSLSQPQRVFYVCHKIAVYYKCSVIPVQWWPTWNFEIAAPWPYCTESVVDTNIKSSLAVSLHCFLAVLCWCCTCIRSIYVTGI